MQNSQTTSLADLLEDDQPAQPGSQPGSQQLQQQMHQQQMQQQMHQQQMQQQMQRQLPMVSQEDLKPVATSHHQEVSMPGKKEHFGIMKKIDYKYVILVFFIVFLLFGIYSIFPRTASYSLVGEGGKPTMLGSLIFSLIGALISVIFMAIQSKSKST